MALRNTNELTPDVRKLLQLESGDAFTIESLGEQVVALSQTVNGLLFTQANSPAAPVGNLLWDGEIGHSVFTWHSITTPPVGGAQIAQNAEAAWFFSHNQPALAQTFTSVNVDTGTDIVTIVDHGFTNGCTVDLLAEAGGTLPAPLAVLTTYFLIVVSPDELQFATSIGNAQAIPPVPINLTTTGTAAKTYTIQQLLLETDSRTSTTNNELKTIAHVNFNPYYSKWDSTNGQADLTGTTSVDILMPSNLVDATTPLARVSLIAARLNSFIEIPTTCLFGCGIWDNTSGQRKFLTGDIGFEAHLGGATGSTERRFRAFYQSDRGFELLSDEVTILNSPAVLSAANNIEMSWLQQSGQLQVEIYEHFDPSGVNEYRLVATISSSNEHIYEGGYLQVVSGYPIPTSDVRTATFYTVTADMSDLAINQVAAAWDTVNFPINVPNNYNKGNTTNRQWVRLWMTVAANLFIPGGMIADGTDTITIPDGVVNSAAFASGGYGTGAAGSSLYAGLSVEIFDQDDVQIGSGNSVKSVTSNTVLVLTNTVPTGDNYKLRIVAGGFHGIIMDKVHLGYQQNTSYVPNANDIRTLQPLAAPASSDQGTVGAGGSAGGVINCIAKGTSVKTDKGWIKVENGKPGQLWAAAQLKPNLLTKLIQGFDNVRRVRSANGVEIVCTDTEAFMCYSTDGKGTPLFRLRVGDPIVTEIDGRIEKSTVTEISEYLGSTSVYTPCLSDNHLFIAGQLNLTRWQQFVNWIMRRRMLVGGLLCHNSKQPADPTVQ